MQRDDDQIKTDCMKKIPDCLDLFIHTHTHAAAFLFTNSLTKEINFPLLSANHTNPVTYTGNHFHGSKCIQQVWQT